MSLPGFNAEASLVGTTGRYGGVARQVSLASALVPQLSFPRPCYCSYHCVYTPWGVECFPVCYCWPGPGPLPTVQ